MSQQDRRFQNIGYAVGAVLALIAVLVLALPGQERFHSSGPANSGHEELSCGACHQQAPGSMRQQIQANVGYWLGMRTSGADYGHRAVDNAVCLECHDRPNDRHPVFRFFEPRFAKARAAIQPQQCVSCHQEHQGVRVTFEEIGYCVHCHQETVLRNDPIDISHEQLIADENWNSCLGCHDFHGNHVMETATAVDQALSPEVIVQYFRGADSPYSDQRYHAAKKEPDDGG